MRLLSWNVNGIRAALKNGFLKFVKEQDSDILCLQETKAPRDGINLIELNGFEQFWNNAKKPGYSGTVIFSKIKPQKVIYGMGIAKHDQEGRALTLEYDNFFLVNVYVPNSQRTLDRLPYRTKEWDVDFLKYLKKREKTKPVVFCGDMNVAHKEIDLTFPKANVKNHGFTSEERAGMDNIVQSGFVDTFRHFNKESGHYTWWSQMGHCRKRNIGWRIDYFFVTIDLVPKLKSAFILKDVLGSDHCPVGIELKTK